MNIDENKIKSLLNNEFNKNKEKIGSSNVISIVHPQLNIYYNSLNVCLGPQGSGKTTFMMFELLKFSQCKDTRYKKVIYISKADPCDDLTFETLKDYLTFDLIGLKFEDSEETLSAYFEYQKRNPDEGHTLIIIEDGTYMFDNLDKDSPWFTWLIRLRHLKLTVWVNVHSWKTINMNIRTQITNLFIFKGIGNNVITQIFNQVPLSVSKKKFLKLYQTLGPHELIRLTAVTPVLTNGEYPFFFEHMQTICLKPSKSCQLVGNRMMECEDSSDDENKMEEDDLFNF